MRWEAFQFVSGYLRAGFLDGVPPARPAGLSWETVIGSSSHHMVTPALAWCLRDETGVPDDVRDYLDAVLALNAQRTDLQLDAIFRVVAALNAIDIEPVLLKGAAALVEGMFPAPALRLLGDIDILIPIDRSDHAVAAIEAIGFSETSRPTDPPLHHLPMLLDKESGAGIELHTRVTSAESILPTPWFVQRLHQIPFRGLSVQLPDATRRVGHNVVHDQISHRNYSGRNVQLRQLLDLALIRARSESEIDWQELDRRFGEAGQGRVLATYLAFAEALFGQPAPMLTHKPRADAIESMRRIIERPTSRGWTVLAAKAIAFAAEVRRQPGIVIQLLNIAKLSFHIRILAGTFRSRKW
jgi:hypothetical protein